MTKKAVIASTEPIHTLAALSLSIDELGLEPSEVFLIAFTYGQPYVTEGLDIMLNLVGIKSETGANYQLAKAETKSPGQLPYLSAILFPAIAASYAAENKIPTVIADSSGGSYPIEAVQTMFKAQEQLANGLLSLFGQEALDIKMPLMGKTPGEIHSIAFDFLKGRFVLQGLDETEASAKVTEIFEGLS